NRAARRRSAKRGVPDLSRQEEEVDDGKILASIIEGGPEAAAKNIPALCSHADWIEAAREHEFAMREWKRRRRPLRSDAASIHPTEDQRRFLDLLAEDRIQHEHDPRNGVSRLPNGTVVPSDVEIADTSDSACPDRSEISTELIWEARAQRAVNLTFIILNILQNFSMMPCNHQYLGRHPTFLDRIAHIGTVDEQRMRAWKEARGRRTNQQSPTTGRDSAPEPEVNGQVKQNQESEPESDHHTSAADPKDNQKSTELVLIPERTADLEESNSHPNRDNQRDGPRTSDDWWSGQQETMYTPAELLRLRKEVLYIITNIISSHDQPHPILLQRRPSTIRFLFDVMELFIADATHFEGVALAQTEPNLGPIDASAVHLVVQIGVPEAIAVAAARSSRRVPQFCDFALEAFSRIVQPDQHRELIGRHVPGYKLVRLGLALVNMLPVSELDLGALQAEARLAYTERLMLCLYNLACASPREVKRAWLAAQPGTVSILWRLIRRLVGTFSSFQANPFNVLIGRIVETLMALSDIDDRFGAAAILGMTGISTQSGGGGFGGDFTFPGPNGKRGLQLASSSTIMDETDPASILSMSDPAAVATALAKASNAAERANKLANTRLLRRDREGPILLGHDEEVAAICSTPGMEEWIITNLLLMAGSG
ncbi:hypothetical protein OC861_006808, partial [Tilletia horrida]